MGVFTPFIYAKMPAGQMAIRTMPMTMYGPGGVHCNLPWATSMPICIFPLPMQRPIMMVRLTILVRWV